MLKLTLVFGILALAVLEVSCQRIIHPTYRPPPRKPIIIRTVREAHNDEPLWLYKDSNIPRAPATGDHPQLPKYIDDIKLDPNRRYARSLDSPSSKRYGGGSRSSSASSSNTGPTHPGYNRRNAREIKLPLDPMLDLPKVVPVRSTRDLHIPRIMKPTHRDVIIPNWNPNVKTNPWKHLGGNKRN